jgi:putative MFS transporter
MPIGQGHRRMFWLLGLGMMVDAFDITMQSNVLASMVHDKFTDTTGMAHFLSATFIGLGLGSILSGVMADKWGRRSVYQLNLLIFGIASLLIVAATNFTEVTILRFIMGIGLGGEIVAGYAIMSEMTPAAHRGRWGILLGLITITAQPLSAFVGAFVLPHIGWRGMFLIGGVPALLIWYFRRGLPESPRWLERKGRTTELNQVLDQIWQENAPGTTRPAVSPAPEEPQLSWFHLFGTRHLKRTLFCFAITALTLGAQYGFLSWVPTLLYQHGQSIVRSMMYSAIMTLGAPLGLIAPIFLIDRIGRRALIASAALLAGAVGIFYAYALDQPPYVLIMAGLLEVFFVQIAATSLFSTYLPELFPTDIRGSGLGASAAIGRLSSALVPYPILYVASTFGTFPVFVMLGILSLVLCALVLMGPETKRKTLEQVQAEATDADGYTPDAAQRVDTNSAQAKFNRS